MRGERSYDDGSRNLLAKWLTATDAELERMVGEALLEDDDAEMPAAARAGGDRNEMRAVPIVGKGVGGTMPGTDPPGALLAKERHRTRRRAGL